jgi:hypothetical protein
MKIAIIHLGSLSQLLPASSVVNGMKKHISTHITWVAGSKDILYIFKHSPHINNAISIEEFLSSSESYDLVINLDPFVPSQTINQCSFREGMGFGFYPEFDELKKVFTEETYFPNINWFQLYFSLCGMVWNGEGYGIHYFPKTKNHKSQVGVSVSNANLRNYVLDHLDLKEMNVWYIPYKKNLFKKMDEINRCHKIITDDLTTLHSALYLRKYVYFLETSTPVVKQELFGSGEIYKVPYLVYK